MQLNLLSFFLSETQRGWIVLKLCTRIRLKTWVSIVNLFIVFNSFYLHLQLYTYYPVPLLPQCKYLSKLVTGTISYFILVYTVYTVCAIYLCRLALREVSPCRGRTCNATRYRHSGSVGLISAYYWYWKLMNLCLLTVYCVLSWWQNLGLSLEWVERFVEHVVSGFRRDVNKICALLGFSAA